MDDVLAEGVDQPFHRDPLEFLFAMVDPFAEELAEVLLEKPVVGGEDHLTHRAVLGRKPGVFRPLGQPSKHEDIRYYEKAQDSVGEAFAGLGLVRGERRRAAYKEAMEAGREPAPYRAHVKTRAWRMQQDRLLKEREAKVAVREADADAVLMVAEAIAAGDVDPQATVEAFAAGRVDRAAPGEDAPVVEPKTAVGNEKSDDLPVGDQVVAKAGADPEKLAAVRSAVTRAPAAAKRVFSAFGAAWKRLRGEAEEQAEERLRGDFDEIRAADKEITRIASILAPKDRSKIVAARESLGTRIRNLAMRFARTKVADYRNKPRRRLDDRKGGEDQH